MAYRIILLANEIIFTYFSTLHTTLICANRFFFVNLLQKLAGKGSSTGCITRNKMKTKAVFFDIDGTLVSFKTHTIPASALEAIHKVREKGVKIFIATGRPAPFINNIEGLEYDGIIESNGAHCQLADGQVIFNKAIPRDDVSRMVEFVHLEGLPSVVSSHTDVFLTAADARTDEVFRLLDIPVPTIRPIEQALDMDVLQIVAFFRKEDEARIMTDILPGCNAQRWHPEFADVIVSGVNKSTGIDAVIRHFGWDLSETMAFGDGGNDIDMLRHVGCGIAMGNASDEVKRHADHVTAHIDDDGVAKALALYLQ